MTITRDTGLRPKPTSLPTEVQKTDKADKTGTTGKTTETRALVEPFGPNLPPRPSPTPTKDAATLAALLKHVPAEENLFSHQAALESAAELIAKNPADPKAQAAWAEAQRVLHADLDAYHAFLQAAPPESPEAVTLHKRLAVLADKIDRTEAHVRASRLDSKAAKLLADIDDPRTVLGKRAHAAGVTRSDVELFLTRLPPHPTPGKPHPEPEPQAMAQLIARFMRQGDYPELGVYRAALELQAAYVKLMEKEPAQTANKAQLDKLAGALEAQARHLPDLGRRIQLGHGMKLAALADKLASKPERDFKLQARIDRLREAAKHEYHTVRDHWKERLAHAHGKQADKLRALAGRAVDAEAAVWLSEGQEIYRELSKEYDEKKTTTAPNVNVELGYAKELIKEAETLDPQRSRDPLHLATKRHATRASLEAHETYLTRRFPKPDERRTAEEPAALADPTGYTSALTDVIRDRVDLRQQSAARGASLIELAHKRKLTDAEHEELSVVLRDHQTTTCALTNDLATLRTTEARVAHARTLPERAVDAGRDADQRFKNFKDQKRAEILSKYHLTTGDKVSNVLFGPGGAKEASEIRHGKELLEALDKLERNAPLPKVLKEEWQPDDQRLKFDKLQKKREEAIEKKFGLGTWNEVTTDAKAVLTNNVASTPKTQETRKEGELLLEELRALKPGAPASDALLSALAGSEKISDDMAAYARLGLEKTRADDAAVSAKKDLAIAEREAKVASLDRSVIEGIDSTFGSRSPQALLDESVKLARSAEPTMAKAKPAARYAYHLTQVNLAAEGASIAHAERGVARTRAALHDWTKHKAARDFAALEIDGKPILDRAWELSAEAHKRADEWQHADFGMTDRFRAVFGDGFRIVPSESDPRVPSAIFTRADAALNDAIAEKRAPFSAIERKADAEAEAALRESDAIGKHERELIGWGREALASAERDREALRAHKPAPRTAQNDRATLELLHGTASLAKAAAPSSAKDSGELLDRAKTLIERDLPHVGTEDDIAWYARERDRSSAMFVLSGAAEAVKTSADRRGIDTRGSSDHYRTQERSSAEDFTGATRTAIDVGTWASTNAVKDITARSEAHRSLPGDAALAKIFAEKQEKFALWHDGPKILQLTQAARKRLGADLIDTRRQIHAAREGHYHRSDEAVGFVLNSMLKVVTLGHDARDELKRGVDGTVGAHLAATDKTAESYGHALDALDRASAGAGADYELIGLLRDPALDSANKSDTEAYKERLTAYLKAHGSADPAQDARAIFRLASEDPNLVAYRLTADSSEIDRVVKSYEDPLGSPSILTRRQHAFSASDRLTADNLGTLTSDLMAINATENILATVAASLVGGEVVAVLTEGNAVLASVGELVNSVRAAFAQHGFIGNLAFGALEAYAGMAAQESLGKFARETLGIEDEATLFLIDTVAGTLNLGTAVNAAAKLGGKTAISALDRVATKTFLTHLRSALGTAAEHGGMGLALGLAPVLFEKAGASSESAAFLGKVLNVIGPGAVGALRSRALYKGAAAHAESAVDGLGLDAHTAGRVKELLRKDFIDGEVAGRTLSSDDALRIRREAMAAKLRAAGVDDPHALAQLLDNDALAQATRMHAEPELTGARDEDVQAFFAAREKTFAAIEASLVAGGADATVAQKQVAELRAQSSLQLLVELSSKLKEHPTLQKALLEKLTALMPNPGTTAPVDTTTLEGGLEATRRKLEGTEAPGSAAPAEHTPRAAEAPAEPLATLVSRVPDPALRERMNALVATETNPARLAFLHEALASGNRGGEVALILLESHPEIALGWISPELREFALSVGNDAELPPKHLFTGAEAIELERQWRSAIPAKEALLELIANHPDRALATEVLRAVKAEHDPARLDYLKAKLAISETEGRAALEQLGDPRFQPSQLERTADAAPLDPREALMQRAQAIKDRALALEIGKLASLETDPERLRFLTHACDLGESFGKAALAALADPTFLPSQATPKRLQHIFREASPDLLRRFSDWVRGNIPKTPELAAETLSVMTQVDPVTQKQLSAQFAALGSTELRATYARAISERGAALALGASSPQYQRAMFELSVLSGVGERLSPAQLGALDRVLVKTRGVPVDVIAGIIGRLDHGSPADTFRALEHALASGPLRPDRAIRLLRQQYDKSGGPAGLEELHGYTLEHVDHTARKATVRAWDGSLETVPLEEVIHESNGLALGTNSEHKQAIFEARLAGLSSSDRLQFEQMVWEAASISREHAVLLSRLLATGEPLSEIRAEFEVAKRRPQSELADSLSMAGLTQHLRDSCAATALQAVLGREHLGYGRALTEHERAAALQQKAILESREGHSQTRSTHDPTYKPSTGKNPLAEGEFAAAPVGGEHGESMARLAGEPGYEAFGAERVSREWLAAHLPSLVSSGKGDVLLTVLAKGAKTPELLRVSATSPDHRHLLVKSPAHPQGQWLPWTALFDMPLTGIGAPKGTRLAGAGLGMWFANDPMLQRDLETVTMSKYEMRFAETFNQKGMLDYVTELVMKGYPVPFSVVWNAATPTANQAGGSAHQLAILAARPQPGNAHQVEFFIIDPTHPKGRWLKREVMLSYSDGANLNAVGKLQAVMLPRDVLPVPATLGPAKPPPAALDRVADPVLRRTLAARYELETNPKNRMFLLEALNAGPDTGALAMQILEHMNGGPFEVIEPRLLDVVHHERDPKKLAMLRDALKGNTAGVESALEWLGYPPGARRAEQPITRTPQEQIDRSLSEVAARLERTPSMKRGGAPMEPEVEAAARRAAGGDARLYAAYTAAHRVLSDPAAMLRFARTLMQDAVRETGALDRTSLLRVLARRARAHGFDTIGRIPSKALNLPLPDFLAVLRQGRPFFDHAYKSLDPETGRARPGLHNTDTHYLQLMAVMPEVEAVLGRERLPEFIASFGREDGQGHPLWKLLFDGSDGDLRSAEGFSEVFAQALPMW